MALGIDPEDRIPGASGPMPSKWPNYFGTSVRVGVVLVVLGAAAASGWPYIREHFLTPSPPSGPLPVIGPGNEPIKEAPKQPGGMQVPDQDKIILNGPAAQPKVEQILPPPPAPLPSPAPSPTPSPAVAQTLPPSPAPTPTPPVAASTLPPPAAASAPPPVSAAASSPVPQTVPVTSPPPPPPPRPASAAANPPTNSTAAATASGERVPQTLAGRGWFVQLGAVSSTAAAQTEWTRLKRTQADLLASLSANAVRVERSSGVIYRIEAGPLADNAAASQLCRSLQQRHVACIVLRP